MPMASSSDASVPPTITIASETCGAIKYNWYIIDINYMKFEEQITGTFWKHYRACLQALKKWIIGTKKAI